MLSLIVIGYIWCKCEACEPGHVVWGINIALGRVRLVNLGHICTTPGTFNVCVFLKCFVILDAGCSLMVMTAQIKAQDSGNGTYVLMFVQSSVCWFFPHKVRFYSLSCMVWAHHSK